MNVKPFILPFLVITALLAGYYFFSTENQQQPLSYGQRIEDHRLELNYFMRASEKSPFKSGSLNFEGLKFFPVNEQLKVKARFLAIDDINKVELPTTDGKVRPYFRYGYLEFEINGQSQRLLVFKGAGPEDNDLFLGFTDPTNKDLTYGGGRYLDINHSGSSEVILDFNLAYNPYCAYNEEFSCPIPPRENKISVPVEAGEMAYFK